MEAAASVQDRRKRGPVTRGNVPRQTLMPAIDTLSCASATAVQSYMNKLTLFCIIACPRNISWHQVSSWTSSRSFPLPSGTYVGLCGQGDS